MVDFDSDGDLDIVVSTSEWMNGVIEVYYSNLDPPANNSPIVFTKDANSVSTTGNTFLFDLSFADVNDDTVVDISISDLFGDVAWYTKAIDGTFTETIIPTTLPNPATLIVEDINNDGNTDIIVSFGSTGSVDDIIWFESTAPDTYFAEAGIDATQTQVYGMTINDFDGDGDKDIASMAFQSNALNWFSNNKIVLGIEDNELDKISIYPNPTSDKLNFKGSFNEILKVSIFDILGKKVMDASLKTNDALDVSKLHTGLYIIKFDEYNTTYKFVKE